MLNHGCMTDRHEIWKMFDAISGTYDRTNRIISLGQDRRWRTKMARMVPKGALRILDCATGTGDQLLALLQHNPQINHACGIDLSEEMLKIARQKNAHIEWRHASCSALPFSDGAFDCVTISFGVRNIEHLEKALHEFFRVLKPGGRLLILETSLPQNAFVRALHLFYLRHLLPKLGAWLSKNKDAYIYLNKSAETFPCGKNFLALLKQAGFRDEVHHPLTFGAAAIYTAER